MCGSLDNDKICIDKELFRTIHESVMINYMALTFFLNQGWIRRKNMKKKAMNEDAEEPVVGWKRKRYITLWQQFLKQYSKTEGKCKTLLTFLRCV